jgi:hypothetical protein
MMRWLILVGTSQPMIMIRTSCFGFAAAARQLRQHLQQHLQHRGGGDLSATSSTWRGHISRRFLCALMARRAVFAVAIFRFLANG